MLTRSRLLTALTLTLAAGIAAAAAPATRPAATRPSAPSGPPAGIERVKLWDNTPGIVEGQDRDPDPTEPTIDIYLPPQDKATGAAVMVLPGGGYVNLSMTNEGSSIAQMFNKNNVAAFVVRYRHGPRYHNPTPLLDAQRAIRTVRARAATYHIDPARVGVIGFSAGGHLAASMATMFNDGPTPESPDEIDKQNARPDFAILMYPVINLTDDAVVHKGSRTALTNNDPSLYAKLSPEQHVTKETPPVFIVQGQDDRTVPVMNSVLFYEACVKAQVPAELHLFQSGRHGFGLALAPAAPANAPAGRGPRTEASLSTWPDLMIRWMEFNQWLKQNP